MSAPVHTYGSTCLRFTKTDDFSALKSSSTPPRVQAQFFYTSSLPIDDPLTPLPPLSSGSSSAQTKSTLPFSARDNVALEESWKALRELKEAKRPRSTDPQYLSSLGRAIQSPLRDHELEIPGEQSSIGSERLTQHQSNVDQRPPQPHALQENTSDEIRNLIDRASTALVEGSPRRFESGNEISDSIEYAIPRQYKRQGSPFGRKSKTAKRKGDSSPRNDSSNVEIRNPSVKEVLPSETRVKSSPFLRSPLASQAELSLVENSTDPFNVGENAQKTLTTPKLELPPARQSELRPGSHGSSNATDATAGETRGDFPRHKITVGVSRLHLVELPNLKMKPIYWSPLHDISDVLRATWFYKNTMLPVDPILANKLENGYLYMRPWMETWQDELNSCVENGAEAEMKIVHRLWQNEDQKVSNGRGTADGLTRDNSEHMDGVERLEDYLETLTFQQNLAAGSAGTQSEVNPFRNSSVIYVDAVNAQILRPSLLPSVSRGRRPLSSIRKGRQIGIPVIRGFSRQIWDKLHPSKQTHSDMRHYIMRPQTRDANVERGEQICYACAIEESRPSPSDLVLMIHGIGQKLSERVESFHFTHAINGFRRSVNMELNNEDIWPHIRPDHGGIMVLPVNWRSTVSLADADIDSLNLEDPSANHYSLKDITPTTIPAVRTLVSDVMLDIPYYLSHHKQKMVQAVVKEANRIYRLWCKNNPGFHQNGRVHLVAHSLGSVMALDILSHQPTRLPEIDFSTTKMHDDIFEFDTKNTFFCGSPAALFLLLNKANLLPRRGRDKPGQEGEDRQPGVAGTAGTYGCLAVDNLYNVMHTTDPIAYRVNPTVDSDLAESLKPTSIPMSTSSFLRSVGSVFRWSSSYANASATPLLPRPGTIGKLPSNVELETRDFTREEIAEKRMLLLNDNGQIDFYISGGGGPLNIQYLNMLSAHSSYWTLPEFIRFIVIEIARRQDKNSVLLALRAEKKKGWKIS